MFYIGCYIELVQWLGVSYIGCYIELVQYVM